MLSLLSKLFYFSSLKVTIMIKTILCVSVKVQKCNQYFNDVFMTQSVMVKCELGKSIHGISKISSRYHDRSALPLKFHPDTVATKFSLAELVDAVGGGAGANILRQELLDAYQVEEHDNPSSDGDGGVSGVLPKSFRWHTISIPRSLDNVRSPLCLKLFLL